MVAQRRLELHDPVKRKRARHLLRRDPRGRVFALCGVVNSSDYSTDYGVWKLRNVTRGACLVGSDALQEAGFFRIAKRGLIEAINVTVWAPRSDEGPICAGCFVEEFTVAGANYDDGLKMHADAKGGPGFFCGDYDPYNANHRYGLVFDPWARRFDLWAESGI